MIGGHSKSVSSVVVIDGQVGAKKRLSGAGILGGRDRYGIACAVNPGAR